jgi:hypothetical protein
MHRRPSLFSNGWLLAGLRAALPKPALRLALTLAALAAVSTMAPAGAAEFQWPVARFKYVASGQSVGAVLKKFAGIEHLQLTMGPGVTGRVSADFDMPAEKLLVTLAEQYHFSWAVEGQRLRIVAQRVAPGLAAGAPRNVLAPLAAGGLELRSSAMPMTASEPAHPVTPAHAATALIDPALTPSQVWSTTPADKTLQNALARWSAAAGWQLFWELPQDYSIEATASINGSFEDAITVVTHSLQSGDVPVTAIFFEGNRVLRIVAKGAQ